MSKLYPCEPDEHRILQKWSDGRGIGFARLGPRLLQFTTDDTAGRLGVRLQDVTGQSGDFTPIGDGQTHATIDAVVRRHGLLA